MRTFIAFDISDEMRGEFSRLARELKKADADVKWVKTENIHLTLKFLGEVEEASVPPIKQALDNISSKNKPFDITLFKLGAFPNLNNPRVLWVGIDRGCAEVEKTAEAIETGLSGMGFLKEERPFSAHFTLGRVRSGRNKAELKERLASLEVKPKSSPIDGITLFRSTLTPTGPIYTPLHKAKFRV